MIRKGILLIIGIILFAGIASAQIDPLQKIVGKLENVHKLLPREKVHLQFDKPYYTIGDTIWFKAYVVNADLNEFSALSEILYVDLINNDNVVKHSLRLPMTVGSAHGDIVLGDTLTEGYYRIRAYTNWMRNFGDDYFFDKTIAVGNALSNKIITKTSFSFLKSGDKETVTADINYSTLDGKPLAAKEVSYIVRLNNRNTDRGKGTTDAQGNLRVTFTNDKSQGPSSGMISTAMKGDDKKEILKMIPVRSASDSISLQFFPEGGQLVEGFSSKVGLKALRSDGTGAEVSGYIADKGNNKVADFKTEHAGMGAFTMIPPQRGNNYKAMLKLPDGSEKRVDFPKPLQKGYLLSIDNSEKDNLRVRVSLSPEILKEGADIILIAQSNNNIYYTAKTKLKAPVLSAVIPKSRFPEGIVQFTLFTGDNIPVAERLVFVDHPEGQLIIKADPAQESYQARQKVKTTIDIGDTPGGSLSVAVNDLGKVPADEDAETTIFSSLLLSSELKGYIEKPNYYFSFVNDDKRRQLDNLIMTQGWRKISWKQMLTDTIAQPAFPVEKDISISGRMLEAGNKKPVVNGKVMLFTFAGGGLLIDTVTDKQGRFSFNKLAFADSVKFVVQARNAKDRNNVIIELDKAQSQPVAANRNAPDESTNASSSMITYIKSQDNRFDEMQKYGMLKSTNIMLKEVQVNGQRLIQGNKEIVENSANMNLKGHYDFLVKAEQLKGYVFLSEALQSKFPGIAVKSDGNAYISSNLTSYLSPCSSCKPATPPPMLVVLDGVPIKNLDDTNDPLNTPLNMITVAEVETIEVLKSGANSVIYGADGAMAGVLVITTKRGKGTAPVKQDVPGIISFKPTGYTIGREFYSPVYAQERTSAMTDLRTVIYWNPELIPGKDGKTSFEFYTADTPGTYRAVIEGLDYTGKPGRKVFTYTVK